MYITKGGDIQRIILKESHRSLYCAHMGVKKMYVDMKHDVFHFITKFLECQQVKANHYHSTGLLQLHYVPMSKWEVISMDFVVGFPLTLHRHNAIIVIVDKLTKSAHFISVSDTDDITNVAHVFITEVIHLHGLPKKMISYRDS
jgi:hypothetical protein